jgi:AIG2 family protein
MALYAAYGSNLDPERMSLRAPHSPLQTTGWLEGWRLTFGGEDVSWEGALGTVVEDPDHRVYVALYDLHPLDEKTLDEWEGVGIGLWNKIRVRVSTLEGDATAWIYVLNAYEGGLPSARYLGMLADAAEVGGAPDDYVTALRSRPCTASDGTPPPL